MQQKLMMKRRIEEAANNRDAGSPLSITDIYTTDSEFLFTRSTT